MSYTYTFNFSKHGALIYISHLDLMRLFVRALSRAQLPVSLTNGFHPHFKIKLNRALKLGIVSENEDGEFELEDQIDELEVLRRWQESLPFGISIKAVKQKI